MNIGGTNGGRSFEALGNYQVSLIAGKEYGM